MLILHNDESLEQVFCMQRMIPADIPMQEDGFSDSRDLKYFLRKIFRFVRVFRS